MFEKFAITAAAVFAAGALAGVGTSAHATTIVVPDGYTDWDVWSQLPLAPGEYNLTFRASQPLTYLWANYYQEVEEHAHADRGDAGWRYIYSAGGMLSYTQFFNGFTMRFIVSPDSETHYDCCMQDTTRPGLEFIGYDEHITYTPTLYATMAWDQGDKPMTLFYRIAAVPEPATWAMMIIGFGGAGVALRRSRKRLQVA